MCERWQHLTATHVLAVALPCLWGLHLWCVCSDVRAAAPSRKPSTAVRQTRHPWQLSARATPRGPGEPPIGPVSVVRAHRDRPKHFSARAPGRARVPQLPTRKRCGRLGPPPKGNRKAAPQTKSPRPGPNMGFPRRHPLGHRSSTPHLAGRSSQMGTPHTARRILMDQIRRGVTPRAPSGPKWSSRARTFGVPTRESRLP